jgi:hypothetical protein
MVVLCSFPTALRLLANDFKSDMSHITRNVEFKIISCIVLFVIIRFNCQFYLQSYFNWLSINAIGVQYPSVLRGLIFSR